MFYDGYIKNIIIDLDAIDNLNDRLAYLHREKKRFAAANRGQDADYVLAWFADEISKVEDMIVGETKSIILSGLTRYDDLDDQMKYLYQEYESHIDSDTGSDEITRWLEQKISLITKKLEQATEQATEQAKPSKRSPIQRTSYRWQGTPGQLSEFCKQINGSYIAPDEDEDDDVKAIFSAKPLNDIKPVRWHDETASELIYFITKIEEAGIIESGKKADYERMRTCFVKPDGTPFNTSSWPSLKYKMCINLSEAKQQAIDKIVEDNT